MTTLFPVSNGQVIDAADINQFVNLLTGVSGDTIDPRALPPAGVATPTTRGAVVLPTLNAKDPAFGARGDGVTDDTAALQAWIAAGLDLPTAPVATTTRNAISGHYLPSGSYRITSPLVFQGIQYLHLYGDGGSSVIKADFTGQAALQMDGIAYSTLEKFRIAGSGTEVLTNVLQLEGTTAVLRTTAHVRFRDIDIQEVRWTGAGIGLGCTGGTGGRQVSECSFWHCNVTGGNVPVQSAMTWDGTYWQAAYQFGNGTYGNVLDFHPYFSNASQCARGFAYLASSGALYGCNASYNGVDIYTSVRGYFEVRGLRSEGSGRLLETDAGSNAVTQTTIANVDYRAINLNPDGYWVHYFLRGSLTLSHVRCMNTPASPPSPARIYLEPGNTGSLTVLADGLETPTGLHQCFILARPGIELILRGFMQLDPVTGFPVAAGNTVDMTYTGEIHTGPLSWGAVNGNLLVDPDTSVYRSGVGVLQTDTALAAGTTLTVGAVSFAASPTRAQLMLGGGAWDGVTSGFYSATGAGTYLGINLASGFTGDALNISQGAAFRVRATWQGNLLTSSSVNAPLLSSGADGTAAGQIICYGTTGAGTTTKLTDTSLVFTRPGLSTIAATGAAGTIAVASQNTANTTAVQRLLIGSGDVAPLAVSNVLLALSDAVNLQLGTGAGTRIGTATTQKLALWNATPVVQPTSHGAQTASGTWGATEQNMLNDVYAALRAWGGMA